MENQTITTLVLQKLELQKDKATEFAAENANLKATDKESYELIKEKHIQVKKTLSTLENKRKEVKREVTAIIDGHAKEVVDILQPVKESLESERSNYEEAEERKKAEAWNALIEPLLQYGLVDKGNGTFAIGELVLTKKDIQKADNETYFAYIERIEEEKQRLQKIEEALAKQEEDKKKEEGKKTSPFEGKAFEQASPSQSTMFDGGSTPEKSPGPNSGKIEPEHGKHRSTLSHVQEIRDYVQRCREEGDTDLRQILNFLDGKLEELKSL